MSSKSEYYLTRAAAERLASRNATDPRAAAIHMEMAECYDGLSRLTAQAAEGTPVLQIVKSAAAPAVQQ